jgi:hypothetical protein
MLMIEVMVSSGTDTSRKKGLVAALVEKLGEAGIGANDIMVFFGRPIARADHSVAAGSHRLLPSPDHPAWHPCGMASKNLEMYRTFAWSPKRPIVCVARK